MLRLFWKTHLAFLLIPLLTLAIEPTNPTGLCDRFLGEQDKAVCLKKVTTADLDWYATTACAMQQEDSAFMTCLSEIDGATFSPEALELCAKNPDTADSLRLACLKKIKNRTYTRAQIKACSDSGNPLEIESCLSQKDQRQPASNAAKGAFQSLDLPK